MTTMILLIAAVVVGALAGLAVRRWFLAPARVESSSMEPTLHPGQRLLVRRRRGVQRMARGDLVLVRSDELGRVVVKRVIGLPRERIDIDREGRVRVNGRLLDEPYARPAAGREMSHFVPDGSLFLLGDNRAASSDSRTWRQPHLREDAVVGRVVQAGASWPGPGR